MEVFKRIRFTKRSIWKVTDNDEEISGYAKTYANFIQVFIRDAGHIVPTIILELNTI
jgi:hypothetical protein